MLLESHVEVNAIDPDVGVALVLEAALVPVLEVRLPGLLQAHHRRCRESWRFFAEERSEGLGEVARRDPLQVQPGDQLFDGFRGPKVRRWDLARESEAIPLGIKRAGRPREGGGP